MYSFSTEVTSSQISSDNPLYQRTLKAYHIVAGNTLGNCLEIGCGEGYGISVYKDKVSELSLIDKSSGNLNYISKQFPDVKIHPETIPPIQFLDDSSYDSIISFQVIEHLKQQEEFIKELHRLLKTNGKAYITTPNKSKTIVRNPWHYKEFNLQELKLLLKTYFTKVRILGIEGNTKTDQYYMENASSVKSILKYDFLNLHSHLPSNLLRVPYEIANRMNRKKLQNKHSDLVQSIRLKDYSLNECNENTLDFYCILEK